MEQRQLGRSGLRVPALAFGAGTFGGRGELFSAWGDTDVAGARELVDICLEAGVTLFDTADVYSDGASEEILGRALEGRRDQALISTKIGLPTGPGPLQRGTSRARLVDRVDAALRRLRTDRIDLLQLHAHDAATPPEELGASLDQLVRSGKVGYVGVSNWSGWQLMHAIDVAREHGWVRPVANQVYYSLLGRDYEWDLMPLGARHGVGALVWSPLAWGRLTGRIRRGAPVPTDSRLPATAKFGPPVDDERLFAVVDELSAIAAEAGATVPQVAIAWLLGRPTVASVIIGARTPQQLRDNLGAATLAFDACQLARLDAVSAVEAPYPHFPYRRQEGFALLDPPLV
ncbi:aryl-alcohol dehydrogenase-like predicted oxidoreductase [Naumannella cuiyingiana]|uniref:Aryl-alcohol dehydrogenase-like predicted oxidoreductase n=1 Tax=Naumannella cuiyingiana TaxID=1347891 RepID=A0A7Z0IKF6_9ACTN|nr:aldo/keto reductase [Naumannella cuiyingiana]NYI70564.1 aryl-alcohol dehydrogenase-like predicted oxidoreductase [Naumannella cuiyingiana]